MFIKNLLVLVTSLTLISACMTAPQHRESSKEKSGNKVPVDTTQLSKKGYHNNIKTTQDVLANLSYPLANKMGEAYQMQLSCNFNPDITSRKAGELFGNYITSEQIKIVMMEHSKGMRNMKNWKCDKETLNQSIQALLGNIDNYIKTAEPILTDPFEDYNRWMFSVNETIYENLLDPVINGYRDTVHENIRISIKNLFSNAMAPVKLVSSLLQLDFEKSGRVIARTLINTTFGIGGLADVAGEEYHIDDINEGFDEALGSFGIPTGPFLVLPLLGPSTTRNTVGRVSGFFMSPSFYFPSGAASVGITVEDNINDASLISDDKKKFLASAPDRYESVRGFYYQNDIIENLALIKAREKLNLIVSKTAKHLRQNPTYPKKFTSSKEINEVQNTTASLHSEPNQMTPKNAEVIKLSNKPNTKIKLKPFASVSNNFSNLTTSKDIISKYLNIWVRAWEKQDIELYISMYAKEFKGTKESHEDWKFSRQAALKKNTGVSIQLQNTQISQSKNTVKINFNQTFKSDRYSDFGIKELVWVKSGNDWRIIKEVWVPQIKPPNKLGETQDTEVAISKDLISKYLEKWVRAWEKQDVELYISMYSKEFKGSKERHADWRFSRQAALKKHANISVQLQNIQVFPSKNTLKVNFSQTFKSDIYSDFGIKELLWVNNGSDWRIIKEIWTPQKKQLIKREEMAQSINQFEILSAVNY